jgi:hypothetical protein
MRIYLPRLGLTPWVDLQVDELESLAAQDRFGVHELTDDPELADVVLYVQCHMVDWRLTQILGDDVARRFWQKVMVYDERDRPWRSLPGVYVSAPSSCFESQTQRAWSYLRSATVSVRVEQEPDLLFSFIGSNTARCRRSVFALRHPDAIIEEVKNFMFWDVNSPDFHRRRESYRSVLARSRFVLCPRGRGTSTIRLYETLAAGRVPVVISDDWVPPVGPDWDACALRVRERDVALVSDMLERRSADWREMSAAAYSAYTEFFSAEVGFHRLVGSLAEVQPPQSPHEPRTHVAVRGLIAAGRESWRSRWTLRRDWRRPI